MRSTDKPKVLERLNGGASCVLLPPLPLSDHGQVTSLPRAAVSPSPQ